MASVVITGTSTGIGFVTALQFAREGYTVFATMRNLTSAARLREAAAAETLSLSILQLDVTDDASVQRAIGEVLAQAGRIDILVNNAGFEGAMIPLEQVDDALMQQTFDTNVFGALRTARAVLSGMREQGAGCIVNVSSVAGRVAGFCMGPYCASKWALESLTETLGLEVRPFGIRVALIEPGVFVTPMIDDVLASVNLDAGSPYADAERRVHALFSQGRAAGADPQAVAETIVRVAADGAPRLRYPVGVGALPLIEGRGRMSDEEWIDFGRKRSDDEFWQEFAERFPQPVTA